MNHKSQRTMQGPELTGELKKLRRLHSASCQNDLAHSLHCVRLPVHLELNGSRN